MKQSRQILTAGLCFTFLLSSAVIEISSAAGDDKNRKQGHAQGKKSRGDVDRDRHHTLEEYVKKRMRRTDNRFLEITVTRASDKKRLTFNLSPYSTEQVLFR